MLSDELESWMLLRQWSLREDTLEKLDVLIALWLRYGAVMNLTGARSRSELLPHVIDGLDTAWLVREHVGQGDDYRWVDFGSGGGFPGLIVSAVGDWPMLLLEPRQKRASFLELALGAIDCKSTRVRKVRFERATWGESAASGFIGEAGGSERIASARAVWGPETWVETGYHVAGTEGHVVVHASDRNSAQKVGVRAEVESRRGTIALASPRTAS